MKQVQMQPLSTVSVTKEEVEANCQRRKRSEMSKGNLKELLRKAEKEKEFQKCFGVKYPSQKPFKI